jgi:hypothetical protein
LLVAKHAGEIAEEGSIIWLLALERLLLKGVLERLLLEGILERLLLLRLLPCLLQTLPSLELLKRV